MIASQKQNNLNVFVIIWDEFVPIFKSSPARGASCRHARGAVAQMGARASVRGVCRFGMRRQGYVRACERAPGRSAVRATQA
jgi:hypothetical protein